MVVDPLIGSLEVIVVDEGGEPAPCAGKPAGPGVVEAVDAHFQRLEPLLDLVTVSSNTLAVQIGLRESGQIAEPVDQQLRLGEGVTLLNRREDRRGDSRTLSNSFESRSIAAYSQQHSVPT